MDKDNVDTTGKPHQVFVDMRQMKSVRVMNTALKIAYLRLHLGLNISIKLIEMLIDAFVMFLSLLGPFEVSFFLNQFLPLCSVNKDWTRLDQITSRHWCSLALGIPGPDFQCQ